MEAGEITFEPFIVTAADAPITCAAYAKEKCIILVDGKDLDISSKRRNNSPEPLNSLN